MAHKPFDFTILSPVRCTAKKKAKNCKGFIKANVLARQPDADVCFKCTPAGKRDTERKKSRKLYKQANEAGIPIG